jgi:hypothetical protein
MANQESDEDPVQSSIATIEDSDPVGKDLSSHPAKPLYRRSSRVEEVRNPAY